MLRRTYEIDMCSGKILPKLFRFAIPLMLSSLLQLLFNAADIIVVGQFGSEHSLAAVGSTSTLVALVTNVFVGIAIGATVTASQYTGAKDTQGIRKVVHTSIAFSMIASLAMMVAGLLLTTQILTWLQTPAEVMPLSVQYMRIYFCGSIPVAVYNFCAALLRAKGDTRRPLYYLIISGTVNVALNLLFVLVFQMDVAGVALATIIAQCISCILVVRCLLHETGPFHLNLSALRIDQPTLRKILRTGVPAGFQSVIFNLSNLVIQSSINSFGTATMAGAAASSNISNFVWVSVNAFSQTSMTFISGNLGAGKYSRLDKINRYSLLCTFLIGTVLGNIVVFFGRPLLHIYTSVPAEVAVGMLDLQLLCGLYGICGLMDCFAANIRGLGYSTIPMLVTLIGACGTRLLWVATLFQLPQFHTIFYLFLSYPVSWAITLIAHLVCYIIIRKRYPKTDIPIIPAEAE